MVNGAVKNITSKNWCASMTVAEYRGRVWNWKGRESVDTIQFKTEIERGT